MLMATLVGGAFMFLVQVAAQRYMPRHGAESQFGQFMALMNALAQMAIPALGLQTVFAQQAGATVTDQQKRELAGTVRGVINVLFVLWLVVVVLAQIFERRLVANYNIENPTALWFAVDAALLAMISPIFGGVLQGRQDFVWYGWIAILNGAGRLVAVIVLIVLLHCEAAGAMAGVLGGLFLSLWFYGWRTRGAWSGETAPIQWKPWIKRVVPLTVALGAYTYMLTHDPIVVQRVFAETSGYNAARVVGVALVFLTTPLAAVMFPKIARSHALSEKTNVLIQALGATGLIGALAAVACMLVPELPLRMISGQTYLSSAPLVPWFAWCMLPLAIANVLINNLLARQRFAVVPWLLAIAVGYTVTLNYIHPSYVAVIQTLGVFSTLLVVVCVVFTLLAPRQVTKRPPE